MSLLYSCPFLQPSCINDTYQILDAHDPEKKEFLRFIEMKAVDLPETRPFSERGGHALPRAFGLVRITKSHLGCLPSKKAPHGFGLETNSLIGLSRDTAMLLW